MIEQPFVLKKMNLAGLYNVLNRGSTVPCEYKEKRVAKRVNLHQLQRKWRER